MRAKLTPVAKEPYNTLRENIRPNIVIIDLTNKILDQIAIRNSINTNTIEVYINVNAQPTTEAETIKEIHVVNKKLIAKS